MQVNMGHISDLVTLHPGVITTWTSPGTRSAMPSVASGSEYSPKIATPWGLPQPEDRKPEDRKPEDRSPKIASPKIAA